MLLTAAGISKRFGGVTALDGVDLEVARGEVHALIGPNGAGKTTLLNLVTRIYDPSAGTISLAGTDLLGLRTHQIIRHGVARIFQHMELFGRLTVLDNVVIGAHVLGRAGLFHALLKTPGAVREQREHYERAARMLAFVGLEGLGDRPASVVTAGQGRLVGLARALMSNPRLLLLDEVAAGLNTQETATVAALVRRLRDERGVTVLVVEHDMRFVMSVADRITVLDFGRRIAAGAPQAIMDDAAVIAAYLGTRGHAAA